MDPELEFLRAENALLRTERDILLRVAAGFAEDANATLLRRRAAREDKRGSTVDTVWLTEEAYARLSDELAALRAADAAGDGEDRVLELRRRQARVGELEDLLRRAVVGQAPPDDGVAEPGMVLTVRFDDDPETETFLLGFRDGGGDLEVYSPDSPLGRALTGARQGESRTYTVPSGATVRVTLVAAVPYGHHAAATGR
ncbi:GreA/GreB family elongation factor [Amycolatopsis thermophila]|uniref:Transcription elongation GreA/GreB family factor n=1 Tax=Amycolatopsis thermophila TaxID=206084 RepID=A0ABU0EYM7_9PSEU|nr:GreA/GreB family elongation factor [Amycolatopsis thermophila]MDQ0380420.1 transcription elongation GreA/GreB family factor [Amycolatopsis thermophila]